MARRSPGSQNRLPLDSMHVRYYTVFSVYLFHARRASAFCDSELRVEHVSRNIRVHIRCSNYIIRRWVFFRRARRRRGKLINGKCYPLLWYIIDSNLDITKYPHVNYNNSEGERSRMEWYISCYVHFYPRITGEVNFGVITRVIYEGSRGVGETENLCSSIEEEEEKGNNFWHFSPFYCFYFELGHRCVRYRALKIYQPSASLPRILAMYTYQLFQLSYNFQTWSSQVARNIGEISFLPALNERNFT